MIGSIEVNASWFWLLICIQCSNTHTDIQLIKQIVAFHIHIEYKVHFGLSFSSIFRVRIVTKYKQELERKNTNKWVEMKQPDNKRRTHTHECALYTYVYSHTVTVCSYCTSLQVSRHVSRWCDIVYILCCICMSDRNCFQIVEHIFVHKTYILWLIVVVRMTVAVSLLCRHKWTFQWALYDFVEWTFKTSAYGHDGLNKTIRFDEREIYLKK